jgi:UDP-N-acetylmuramoyl-tripeptide--D-alanyl-D-alanine ligase
MKSSLAQLQPWIPQARATADAVFDGVSTDSRNLAPGNLFVALRGEHFDGHAFVNDELATRGVAAVVAEYVPPGFTLPTLVVPDTRTALGDMARGWRRGFALPLIGVTGSNGKTTVKEMIAAILSVTCGPERMLATRGNLNNDIGVPLTLFRLHAECRAAVIELGMNHPGEIAQLAAIAQPTAGLVNNAQREHQEFMQSVEAVALENGAVLSALPHDGVAVFPSDDPYTALWRRLAGQRRVVSFGLDASADVSAEYVANAFGSDLSLRVGGQQLEVRLNAPGVHNVRNALAGAACALAIGLPLEAVVRGLEAFAPVSGRLQRKQATSGALVIDDTYNANPDSVCAAIDVLVQFKAPRVLVLGDMGEVGSEGRRFHEEVGAYAAACGVDHFLTLGTLARHASAAFGPAARHHTDIEALKHDATGLANADTTLLIKGSRFMQMERVVRHLVAPSTTITSQGAH